MYYLGSRILFKGLEGSDVEELQKKLKKLGYDIIVSGYFGDKTEKAVINFQQNNELKPDGRVGSKTIEIINIKL
ncbi:hypothetical protein IW16_09215 [Chryseobacterium vrystaatense]|uniref:Peptidoglycan binding-like domain-containing protein n=1 Tax=Chryseobacterium vrystaatense TaxID=307480 RepID=A0ABR4UQJ1_9FLAO|nr:hypothetical protein IW16_09215 [Chryseobacterium vrystaatense]